MLFGIARKKEEGEPSMDVEIGGDEIRHCASKNCGNELPRDSKHAECDNCRKKKAQKLRQIGGGIVSLVVAVSLTATRVVKKK